MSQPNLAQCYALIEKYYADNPECKRILTTHVEMVRAKALEIADRVAHLNPDRNFIEEASLLHDIGIFKTNTPSIHCHGTEPYIAHGYLGRELLEAEGLPRHALVADRHTGSGLAKDEIIAQKLPIPARDMLPLSIEEKIVCYADCFYTKKPDRLKIPKTIDEIRASFMKSDLKAALARFDELHALLG